MKFLKVDTERNEKNPITGRYESADYVFWCDACKFYHGVWTTNKNKNSAIWTFNGDINKPTVSPSILVKISFPEHNHICHSFIKDGNIQYLGDCTHSFANMTVELKDIENI